MASGGRIVRVGVMWMVDESSNVDADELSVVAAQLPGASVVVSDCRDMVSKSFRPRELDRG